MRVLLLVLLLPTAHAWSLGDAPSESLPGAYAPGAATVAVAGSALWAAAPEVERRQFTDDVTLTIHYQGVATGTRVAALMLLAPDGSMDALGAAQASSDADVDTFVLPVDGEIIEAGEAVVLSLRYPAAVVIDGAASGFVLPLMTIPEPGVPEPEAPVAEPVAEPTPPATVATEATLDWAFVAIAGVVVLAGMALIGGRKVRRVKPAWQARALADANVPRRPRVIVTTTAEQMAGPALPKVQRPRQDTVLEDVQAELVQVEPAVVVQAVKRPKAPRCVGLTATGSRCRRPAVAGMDTCHQHQTEPTRTAAGPWA